MICISSVICSHVFGYVFCEKHEAQIPQVLIFTCMFNICYIIPQNPISGCVLSLKYTIKNLETSDHSQKTFVDGFYTSCDSKEHNFN